LELKNPDDPAAPLALVDSCLARGCFAGVKLYPPMGYRAINNAELDGDATPFPTPDFGARLDKVMKAMFVRCASAGWPVMAHNNRSRASADAFLDQGHPRHWGAALAKYPGLRVNLGHFGGMALDPEHNWSFEIARLTQEHPGAFMDIGDFDEGGKSDRRAYLERLKAWCEANPKWNLFDRLMYGSDYFMNSFPRGRHRSFAKEWIESFKKDGPAHSMALERFSGLNALEFLGLRRGQQRDRLNRFFTEHNLEPDWVQAVDKLS
jgi:predicted TIM-barrel fold metal-dependent hydrolase